jgi:hypothetical protein
MKRILRSFLARAAVACAAFAAFGALAAPQLLVPYEGPVAKSAKPKDFKSEGFRVQFNLEALKGLKPGAEVAFSLPNGTSHTLIFDLLEDKGDGITSWVGRYKGSTQKLRAIITTGPGGSFGRISTPDGDYAIVPGEGHDWLVDMKAEQPHLPPIDLKEDTRVPPPRPKSLVPQSHEPQYIDLVPGVNTVGMAKAVTSPAPAVVVDLMFAYTTGLRIALGASLQTRLQSLVTSANTAFDDSGVAIKLRLVNSVEVNYVDTGDNGVALDDISPVSNPVNPAFANIEALRLQYGADMVSLLRNGSSLGGSGIAWIANNAMGPGFAPYMYSVVTGCTAGCDWVWVHEIGHNMGNAHDRATAAWQNGGVDTPGSYPYSFGYYSCQGGRLALSCNAFGNACGSQPECNTPASGTNNFADIMAYFHASTVRNLVFSNPNLSCRGALNIAEPCGINDGLAGSANAALSMNNNREALSGLFATKVGAGSTTTVTSSLNPSTAGQSVTFTANVSGAAGTPTGTVEFTVNGASIAGCGAVTLNASGSAACATTSLAGGSNTIRAQYNGSTAYTASTSNALTQTVNIVKTTPAVALSSSLNPSNASQSIAFTAAVSGGSGAATGTVTFQIDGVAFGACTNLVLASGAATCTTGTLSAGAHTIQAQYSGNAGYNTSSSNALNQTVRSNTTATVSTSLTPSVPSPGVTFTASLSYVGGVPAGFPAFVTGDVDFLANGALLSCSPQGLANGVATCGPIALGAGDHSITVSYRGNPSFNAPSVSAPITQVIRLNSTTTLASAANPASLGQPVTFTATISGALGTHTGTVAFRANGTPINGCGAAAIVSGLAKCNTSALAAGTPSITAHFTGDGMYFASASSALSQTVSGTPYTGFTPRRLDFNGDGNTDLVWQGADGTVSVWLMDATQPIARAPIFGAASGATVKSGDFNGDGRADLVRTLADGTTTMTLLNGVDPVATGVIRAASGWRIINVGDLNGDGRTDLLWRHTDGTVEVWFMNGLTATSSATLMGAGTGWTIAKVGDFNGDGKTDLIWAHTDGSAGMWLMNGANVLERGPLMTAAVGWSVAQVGDFDGDGKSDLVWVNTDGSVGLWLMEGLTVRQRGPLMGAGTGWSPLLNGDFNADGRSDLIWRHVDGTTSMWIMNGHTIMQRGPLLGAGSGWTVRQAGFYSADPYSDLVWVHDNGSVSLWTMFALNASEQRIIMGPATGWAPVASVEQNR